MPSTHTRRVPTLLATALLIAGCVGQTTPSPTAPPSLETTSQPTPNRTLPPRPTPTPDLGCDAIVAAQHSREPEATLPPVPNPKIAGADANVARAIEGAARRLAALDSYRFTVDAFGIDVIHIQQTTYDYSLRGTIDRSNGFAMDTLIGTRMREPDGSAAISSGGRWVVDDEWSWAVDNLTEVLEPRRRGSGDGEAITALVPEGIAGRLLVPFAAGYRRLANEKHGGVMTQHFRATARGANAYASALQFEAKTTADVWIASDGGYLAGARIAGTVSYLDSSGVKLQDTHYVEFDVSGPNDPANVVEHPMPPLPDPIRPGKPVDLRLEYEVMRSDVRDPTTQDVKNVGVAMRSRLGISLRPLDVTVGQPDRVIVTVCGTTRPESERQLIISRGGVTVVALPVSDYGTTAKSGPRALPAVGSLLDPDLAVVAGPARIGLGSPHVDPVTGRRGIAFHLENRSAEVFRAFAKDHPGEFVALLLDGTVLATLPIDDQLSRGLFMFIGDYTEAETRLLINYLYTDPLGFALRLVRELEVPASR